ncbi:MAG TPA: phage holin family protein [Kofleriaceae bacterium]|nr:phage holin family protein [Kofleriaceae bacterium]
MMSKEGSGTARPPRDESTKDLLGGVLSDAKELVAAHGEQIKLEVRSEIRALKETIILTGIAAGAVVLAGLLLGHAAALGLAALTGLPMWASYGLVGGGLATGGYVLYRSRPPMQEADLVPEDSIASIKRDVARVADAVERH